MKFDRKRDNISHCQNTLVRQIKAKPTCGRRFFMIRTAIMAFVILVWSIFNPAQATLLNNGNNLIYDTDLKITWYNPSISDMDWYTAVSWANSLTAGGVTGWRLPSARNTDGSYPTYEYNVTGSELGHLYYTELGNIAGGPLTNTGPFAHLQSINYWASESTERSEINAFIFNFGSGRQGHANKPYIAGFSALAVHSGYVHTPLPGAIFMFVPGLVGLAVIRKKFIG